MSIAPAWPHCPSCTCSAPVPDMFVSDVRQLPVDLQRVAVYTVGRGKEQRVEKHDALDLVDWIPGRRKTLRQRVNYYRLLIEQGTCGNIREAVKMTAIKRREWEAQETAQHAERLARNPRTRCRNGYERSLASKKKRLLVDAAACTYCGTPNPRTVDHIVPVSQRRDHRRENLAPACWPCNQEKGNRTPKEWRAARLDAGLQWPPEQRDQSSRTFPGTLPQPQASTSVATAEEATR